MRIREMGWVSRRAGSEIGLTRVTAWVPALGASSRLVSSWRYSRPSFLRRYSNSTTTTSRRPPAVGSFGPTPTCCST